jgi:glucose-1-phosphate cytidylyltransferase
VRPSVVILCGGRGERLAEHARSIPKPLVPVGGRPILWHVISLHIAQGFTDFLLLTGARGDRIAAFAERAGWPADVRIRCLDTGGDTPTGGRLHHAADVLGGERFCLAYADAVADIALGALIEHHDRVGGDATMAVVRPRLPFGVARLSADGDRVRGFDEKPVSEQWVNAGFFCLEPAVLARLRADSVLEREPLSALAREGRLAAYRHDGFWHCMDTPKDVGALNDLWGADPAGAPWLAPSAAGVPG